MRQLQQNQLSCFFQNREGNNRPSRDISLEGDFLRIPPRNGMRRQTERIGENSHPQRRQDRTQNQTRTEQTEATRIVHTQAEGEDAPDHQLAEKNFFVTKQFIFIFLLFSSGYNNNL